MVTRLQGDPRNKNEHINSLSEEIDAKNLKIAELQGENGRYRNVATDLES